MEKAHNLINIKKSKMSNYTSIIDHIFRKHRQYKNQNINSEKTELNTIILDKFGYKNGNFELSEYFKKNKIKTKKDSVVLVNFLCNLDEKIFENMGQEEMTEVFKKNLSWLEKEYPKMNFISAVIHYDEKKPHMHVCAIPLAVKEKKLTQREVLKELTKLNLSEKKSDKEFIKKFQNEHKYTATTLSAKKYFDGKSSLYELQNKWFEYQKELFKDKNIEILRRKHEGRRYIKNIEVFKAEAQKVADEMTEELKIEDIQIPEAKVSLEYPKIHQEKPFWGAKKEYVLKQDFDNYLKNLDEYFLKHNENVNNLTKEYNSSKNNIISGFIYNQSGEKARSDYELTMTKKKLENIKEKGEVYHFIDSKSKKLEEGFDNVISQKLQKIGKIDEEIDKRQKELEKNDKFIKSQEEKIKDNNLIIEPIIKKGKEEWEKEKVQLRQNFDKKIDTEYGEVVKEAQKYIADGQDAKEFLEQNQETIDSIKDYKLNYKAKQQELKDLEPNFKKNIRNEIETEFKIKEDSLKKSQEKISEKEKTLEKESLDLNARKEKITQRENGLNTREEKLHQREINIEPRENALNKLSQELSRKDDRLQKKEQEIDKQIDQMKTITEKSLEREKQLAIREQKVGRTENKIFLSQDEEISNYFFNIFELQAQIENYDDITAQIEERNKINSVKQNKISNKIKNFISNLSDLFNQGFYELVDFVKTKVKNFSVNKQIEEKIPENDEIFFGLVEDYKNCEKEEKIEKLRREQDRGFSR